MQRITGIIQTLPQQTRGNIKPTIASSGEEYNKGYQEGFEEGKKESYNKGYTNGVTDGKQAEYDAFWDNLQDYGNRTYYSNAFYGDYWNDITFKPKYPIVISGSNQSSIQTFAGSNSTKMMTEINVDIILDVATANQTFYGNFSIRKIKKIILLRDDIEFYRTFGNVTALVDITFEGVISKNIAFADAKYLSDASIQNIIDRLADLTGQTAQTLDFHSTVVAKLTDEQILQIDSKNWGVI